MLDCMGKVEWTFAELEVLVANDDLFCYRNMRRHSNGIGTRRYFSDSSSIALNEISLCHFQTSQTKDYPDDELK